METIDGSTLEAFRAGLRGTAYAPGEEGYDGGLYRGALRGAGALFGDLFRLPDGGHARRSLAPIIATALLQWADGASWPVATYLAANSLISLVAVYLASENYQVGIYDERLSERIASEQG